MDRHDLYELSVQAPGTTARFLRAVHGGSPRILAEDFCATGALCRAWVGPDPDARAVGVDKDPAVLESASRRARAEAGDDASRITFICADVRNVDAPADVLCALNFGLCEFHERRALVRYLSVVRARLAPNGVAVFDLYGGPGALVPSVATERIEHPDGEILYTWEQRSYDPVTARAVNAISYRLPDDTRLDDAFVYDWRLWSLPEVADALADAEFETFEVYDRYADALDESGRAIVTPLATDEHPLDEDYVVFIAARV